MSTAAPTRRAQVAWALETLDVPSDTTTRAVRSAIVAQLEECEFVPPPIVIEVLEVLAPYAAGSSAAAQQEGAIPPVRVPAAGFNRQCERRLREQVDAFAEQFFSLAVPVRHATWTQLVEQAHTFPAVMLRLQALRPALGLICPAIADSEHRALAEACLQLFVMRPAARAVARSEFLHRCTDNNWVRSAKQFARRYPPLAALAPDLFEVLKKWRLSPKTPPSVVVQTRVSPQVRGLMGWFIAMMITGTLALLFIGSNARDASRRSSPPRSPIFRIPESEVRKNFEEIRRIQEEARQRMRERPVVVPEIELPSMPPPESPSRSIRTSSFEPPSFEPPSLPSALPPVATPPGAGQPPSSRWRQDSGPPTPVRPPGIGPSHRSRPGAMPDPMLREQILPERMGRPPQP